MATENKIYINLESKEKAEVNLALSDSSGAVQASAIDITPIIKFITTGPAGPQGEIGTLTAGGVQTVHISSGAITEATIGSEAVTSSKIGDGAVTSAKIGSQEVTTGKIADDAITQSKLADNSVGAAQIIDGTVSAELLSDGTITDSKYGDLTIATAKIKDSAITGIKCASNLNLSGEVQVNNLKLKGSSPSTITGPDADKIIINSNTDLEFRIDANQSASPGTNSFIFKNGSDVQVAALDESGNFTLLGTVDGVDISSLQNTYPSIDSTKVGYLTVTQAVNLDTIESNVALNNAKNTYAAGDATKVGYLSISEAVNLDSIKSKVNGIAANAEVNVQSDWSAGSGDAQILNKPTIPSGNSILDWTADQGGTNIHAGNYTDTNTTYSEATGVAEGLMSTAHHDKLDAIEASADVTDATNVAAAGALMDSELTDLAGVKGITISTLQVKPSEGPFVNGDKTKLDGAAPLASPTFTGIVRVPNVSNVETAITDNTAKVTNVTTNLSASADGTSLTVASSDGTNASIPAATTSAWGAMTDEDKTKLDGIESSADVTDATNVTSAGALMDSELTDLAGVKGVTISTLQIRPSEGAFVNGDKTKLDGIETGANRYTNASAVSAVSTADDYLKNDASDTITGDLTIDSDWLYIKDQSGSAAASRIGTVTLTGNQTISLPDATGTLALINSQKHFINFGVNLAYALARWIPWGSYYIYERNTNADPEYTTYVAPYDGKFIKLLLRSEESLADTAITIYKVGDGTEEPDDGSVVDTKTVDIASANTSYTYTFDSDATFSKGDAMAVKIHPTTDPVAAGVVGTFVLEFDLTT